MASNHPTKTPSIQAPLAAVPFICLAGPTASGKSAASLLVAQHVDVEIISVDSALVYRGMDIGTAKPSAHELASVPHHLIDIIEPSQTYSAAQFVQDATRLIADIHARGKLPLLVGGTMLYFKALLQGIDDMPPADAQVRAQINSDASARGWAAMHAELAAIDPASAARLHINDTQRIQRALEVFRVSGKPISDFFSEKVPESSIKYAQAAPKLIANPRSVLISLEPANRAWLHERIAQRFAAMLAAGLVDEVRRLRTRGDLHPDLPSMRCVGYRQTWDMLDGALPTSELLDRGIFATRQLAKRQITWLRSMPNRIVVACDEAGAPETVLRHVTAIQS